MKSWTWGIAAVVGLVFLTGCSLSPDEKVAREQTLKQAVDSFTGSVVQGNWGDAYQQSDGGFESPDGLKTKLMKSWVQDSTLTGGQIVSMAWVTDTMAKVKLNWSFQTGSVESFSSETFVWAWNGKVWKFRGRTLR